MAKRLFQVIVVDEGVRKEYEVDLNVSSDEAFLKADVFYRAIAGAGIVMEWPDPEEQGLGDADSDDED